MNTHQAGLMMAHGQNMASQMMSQGQSQASAMMAHNQNMASQMAGGMPAPGFMAGGAITAPFGGGLGATPGANDPPVRGGRMAGRARGREAGAGMPPMPFGGFRADGGDVRPGRKYIVGERGPEFFVPKKPGVVIPMRPPAQRAMPSGNNPVNGKPSTFDGKSRTEFFGAAMKAGTGGSGPAGGSVRVYDDIRQEAAGQMPRPDIRSFGPGGMNFSGPPAPPREMMPPPPTGGPGMLVAGPGGSAKWQPSTGPGATRPPQFSMPPSQMPFGMGAPASAPMLIRSGAKTMNANQSGTLAGRGTHGEQTSPLSLRLPVPKGRSANDPQRIAEQLRRRGDPRYLMQFGMQQMGQDFARERDAVNFAQSQAMFGQQQSAMDTRDARNFEQQQQMDAARWNAMSDRDKQNFIQQQQLETERRAAETAERERERARVPVIGQVPIPGTNYAGTYADGRPMGNVPMQQGKPAVPAGMEPKRTVIDGTEYGPPDDPKKPKFVMRDLPGEMVQDPVTRQWKQLPGQTVRIYEDGTYEPITPRGQQPAAAAPADDPKARLNALRAAAGLPPL